MQIKSAFTDSYEDIETVCVAIGRPIKSQNQLHIGFYYKGADEKIKFLHLAWHYDLRKGDPDNKYLWLEIPLDPINRQHLAVVLELIYEANKNGIPYGICIDGAGFSKEGNFTAEEHYAGLTCATFVIQVLHSQKIFIIDFSKWKHRQADKKWQIQILQKLSAIAPKEHIEYQRAKILSGAARFKPEEVAVAATLPNPPHGFEEIKASASRLLNIIIEHSHKIES